MSGGASAGLDAAGAGGASLEESGLFTPRFNADGVVPCVTVDAASGDVVMLAWMNAEALRLTLETGFVHYWSRSRQALWKKGETSGALQQVAELRTDCDQDAILVRAIIGDRTGTCHTGRETCFYRSVPLGPGPLARPFAPGD